MLLVAVFVPTQVKYRYRGCILIQDICKIIVHLEPSRADKASERSEFSIQTIFENIQILYTSFDLGLTPARENAVFVYRFLDM